MISRRNVGVTLGALLVSLVSSVSPAFAAKGGGRTGGGYSCKGDGQLDAPMQFTATVESAGRVHVSASGGSDKSGYVEPYFFGAWRVRNSSGASVTFFTQTYADTSIPSLDMLKESYVEGLLPGAYTIQLTSMDLCGNLGYSQRSVTIPSPVPESPASGPVISTPTVAQVGGLAASAYCLYFTGTDNTGIKRITVYINGTQIAQYNYFDGVNFRWWTAFYPDDSVLASYEGPSFYLMYPDSYKAQYVGTSQVQIVAEDVLGNQSTASAQLNLP